jgi:hypothetical protein
MQNDLMTISQAAAHYRTSLTALLRMDSEGLVRMVRLNGYNEFFVRVKDMDRVVELAKDDPRLLCCTCVGGPCECPITE